MTFFLISIIKFTNGRVVLANEYGYRELASFLNETGAVNDLFRSLFWGTISFLRWITNGAEQGINEMIMLPNQFLSSEQMQSLINIANIIFILFIPLSIMYVGYQVIWAGSKGQEALKRSFRAIGIALIVMSGSTWLLTTGMELTARSVGALNDLIEVETQSETVADTIILGSLVDLHHAVNFGSSFTTEDPTMLNNLGSIDLDRLSFNEGADRDIQISSGVHLFRYRSIWLLGDYRLLRLSDGRVATFTIDFFVGHVYQYQVINWFAVIIQLGIVAVALTLTGIKIARMLYELAYKQLIIDGIAVLSLSDSAKVKKLFSDIGNTFLVIFLIVLFFKMYANFTVWLNGQSFHFFVYLFFLIGASLSLIDGPVFIQKLTGVDAGISSDGLRTAFMLTTILPGIGRMFGGAGRAAANTAGAAGNFAGGLVDGVSDGLRTGQPEKESTLNAGNTGGKKPTTGHDFDANKQDKQSQNPVGFGDANAKENQNQTTQNNQEQVPEMPLPNVEDTNNLASPQNDLSGIPLSDFDNVISGNPENPFMDEFQGPAETLANDVNKENGLPSKEENTQPRPPLGNPHTRAYKVGNFLANTLSGRTEGNLMFPTKAKSDISGGVNREDTPMASPSNATASSKNVSGTKQSSSNFFEPPTSRQLHAASRMGVQNAHNMNRGQLSQALEVAGMEESYWERKNE